ncbi:hypothetical protein B0H66DRAFT_551767 [Apodospora peruviana]|uniref:Uncharacterized protein n=1 Tax=Apodospora peruviana TaxID=516989 RepID=A0AAE0IM21_9PEZI|nr:hypothetical protein B0H66DRAFT_551767 [Apodospora peruviana]
MAVNQQTQTVFLTLPGTCTGDLWHHAAAQILHEAYGSKPYDLITVLGTISEERDFNHSIRRAPAVFNYFRQIRAPCVLARISYPDGGEFEFSEKMLDADSDQLLRLFREQQQAPHFKEEPFEVLWPKLEIIQPDMKAPEHKTLHYFLSTTIAMQSLSLEIDREERVARLVRLGDALAGGSSIDDEIDRDVSRKIDELRTLIALKRSSTNARILLYNWRGPSTYPGHASLPSHLSQVTDHASRHGMLVIRVAAGVSGDEIQDTDLDLFDARAAGSSTIRDKRFTARFWRRVARELDSEVFGLIGGRSGSVDVAAFVGLNCYEWDEPVFNIAAAAAAAQDEGPLKKEYVDMQVPQYLRLLNQCSVVSVGLLDVASHDLDKGVFTRLEETELDRWLGGEVGVYPPFPDNDCARELLVYNIGRIEDCELGILATNLRRIWVKS